MNEKKKVDKENPKYKEYIRKCRALADEFSKKEEEILVKYPAFPGLDSPAEAEIQPYRIQFNDGIRELQREYSFLFG